MSRRLAAFIMITDILFLLYWLASGLAQLGLVDIPPQWMYAEYGEARVVAWNWSFLPLDVAFSAVGLAAVVAARRGSDAWRPLALLSLAFTIASGLNAVSYWTLLGELDPGWFLSNLLLVVWPLFFLPGLITGFSTRRA